MPLLAFSFAAPLLAWGALACLLPVVVHLIFRERPRRQVFPALRLLSISHASQQRAQRLRHWLLLLLRMLAIVFLVTALMRPWSGVPASGASAPARATGQPYDAVILAFDSSASMGYRFQGQTRVQAALQHANALLADPGRCPPNTPVAILAHDLPIENDAWTTDRTAARRTLHAIRVGHHDQGLAPLLNRIDALTAATEARAPAAFLFSDLTTHACRAQTPWSDSPTPVILVDVGQPDPANASLTWPELHLPEGSASSLPQATLNVRAAASRGQRFVTIRVNGEPHGRAPVPNDASSPSPRVGFPLPDLPTGQHALSFTLHPADALPADNTRFAVLPIRDAPRVVIIRSPGDTVADMLGAMIAPPVPNAPAPYHVVGMPPERIDSTSLANSIMVIVVASDASSATSAPALQSYLRNGGTLLIVPEDTPLTDVSSGDRSLFAARPRAIEILTEPTRLAVTDFSPAWLRAFADDTIDSLNDREVFRRVRVGLRHPDARIVARYADGVPAILQRPIGEGTILQWTFSPAATWSRFGTQAAPMIVLLHSLLNALAPGDGPTASFPAGPPRPWPVRGVDASTARLLNLLADTQHKELPVEAGQVKLPCDQPGVYAVSPPVPADRGSPTQQGPAGQSSPRQGPAGQSSPRQGTAGQGTAGQGTGWLTYSVNVAEPETLLTRCSPDQLRERFPARSIEVILPEDTGVLVGATPGPAGSWTAWMALGALALLIVETFLSNRLYGTPPVAADR